MNIEFTVWAADAATPAQAEDSIKPASTGEPIVSDIDLVLDAVRRGEEIT